MDLGKGLNGLPRVVTKCLLMLCMRVFVCMIFFWEDVLAWYECVMHGWCMKCRQKPDFRDVNVCWTSIYWASSNINECYVKHMIHAWKEVSAKTGLVAVLSGEKLWILMSWYIELDVESVDGCWVLCVPMKIRLWGINEDEALGNQWSLKPGQFEHDWCKTHKWWWMQWDAWFDARTM